MSSLDPDDIFFIFIYFIIMIFITMTKMKWEVHRLLNSNRYLASVTNNPARKPDLDLSHYKAHATSIVPHCPQQAHLDPHFVYSEVFCFFLLFLSSSLPLPCQKKKKKGGAVHPFPPTTVIMDDPAFSVMCPSNVLWGSASENRAFPFIL